MRRPASTDTALGTLNPKRRRRFALPARSKFVRAYKGFLIDSPSL